MELQAENTSSILPVADSTSSIQQCHQYDTIDTSCEILSGAGIGHHDQRSLSYKGSFQGDQRHLDGISRGGSSSGGYPFPSQQHYPPAQMMLSSPPGQGHAFPGMVQQHQEYQYQMGMYPQQQPHPQAPYPPHHGQRPHIPYPQSQQPRPQQTLNSDHSGPPTYKDVARPGKPAQNGISVKKIADEPCSFIMNTDTCLFLSIALSALCLFCGAYVLFCTIPAVFLTFLAKSAQLKGETAILQANLRITSFCIISAFVVWLIFSTFIVFMVALTAS